LTGAGEWKIISWNASCIAMMLSDTSLPCLMEVLKIKVEIRPEFVQTFPKRQENMFMANYLRARPTFIGQQ